MWKWPGLIPFSFFQFWPIHGSFIDALKAAMGIFIIGTVVSILSSFLNKKDEEDISLSPKVIFAVGTIISFFAGVFEEISFRWLLFFSAIVGYTIINWIFFGFLGFGISEWLFEHVFGPFVDIITAHILHTQLYQYGWAVGAALISTNGKFRDGHTYQGTLGWINAWIAGIYLFFIMFHYGLPVAIIVHIVYDLYCYTSLAIAVAIKKKKEK